MALRKKIDLPSGISANYLVVKSIHADFDQLYAQVHVVGYLDKQNRDGGNDSVFNDTIEFYGVDFPFTTAKLNQSGSNPQKVAYTALKGRTARPGDVDYSDGADV